VRAPALVGVGRGGSRRRRRSAGPAPALVVGDGDTAVLFAAGRALRPATARALYGTFPVFRREFDAVCQVLDVRLPLPLAAVVFAPEGGVDARLLGREEFDRAALFAYEVALYRTWQDWGLRIGAVAGDGIGALVAAHVAGLLDLDEAARRAVPQRRVRAHGTVWGAPGERTLRAAGLRLLLCGPGPEGPLEVGHVPALLAAVAGLQLCGPPLDWEALWCARHRPAVPQPAGEGA
jgi:acyl transferase domain-containing protein